MTVAALCEFVWVVQARRIAARPDEYRRALSRTWLAAPTCGRDRPAVEAGLAMLDAGGDFADGVIAFTGRQLGGSVFASFDRKAVELVDGGRRRDPSARTARPSPAPARGRRASRR